MLKKVFPICATYTSNIPTYPGGYWAWAFCSETVEPLSYWDERRGESITITVVGKDTVGILAKVSSICAEHDINITEVSQTILDDMFCMIMLADISKSTVGFVEFSEELTKYGEENNLSIHAMHEDIFNSMHRI